MSAIFLLIPLGLLMLALAIWAFIWAVQKRQFQDLDSAGHSILMEEKTPKSAKPDSEHHD